MDGINDTTTLVDPSDFSEFDMPGTTVGGAPAAEAVIVEQPLTVDDVTTKETIGQPGEGSQDAGGLPGAASAADIAAIVGMPGEEVAEGEGEQTGAAAAAAVGMQFEAIKKLIDAGTLLAFDEDKPIEDYTSEDFTELIEANIAERERVVREQTPKEFYESLPPELRFAAEYVAKGGKDMKGIFQALSQVEEVRQLDIATPEGQKAVVRNWLQATQFGSATEIEEEISGWEKTGSLEQKAKSFKPRLDQATEQQVTARIAKAAELKSQNLETARIFRENVSATLQTGDLAGIKITADEQRDLYSALTEAKFTSRNGRATNEIGHLLEQYQFGEAPNYAAVAKALLVLRDPEAYDKRILERARTEVSTTTARTLKTEAQRAGASTTATAKPDTTPARRTLPKPGDSFRKHFS